MSLLYFLTSLIYLPLIFNLSPGQPIQVQSPNRRMALSVMPAALRYSLLYDQTPIIQDGALGVVLTRPLGELTVTGMQQRVVQEDVAIPFGERESAPNAFHQLKLTYQELSAPGPEDVRTLEITFVAYNEGVAFRYTLTGNGELALLGEQTTFAFTQDHTAYKLTAPEGEYGRAPLAENRGTLELPLTLQHVNGFYFALLEAGLRDYSRARLAQQSALVLAITLDSPVTATQQIVSPWRLLLQGENEAALLQHNYLVYNLNSVAQGDYTWVKPGSVIRAMSFQTGYLIQLIDAAVQHGIKYIELDAGWYGLGYAQEHNPLSDATAPVAELDMNSVAQYAESQGVGLILYVNRVAIERQLTQILPLYQQWGVDGLKLGFMDGRTQAGLELIEQTILACAQHRMLVDVHDNYIGFGLNRTFPNLLTQEGVRGNEYWSDGSHTTTLPFTRFLAGAADYTFPYYSPQLQVTQAHQLALPILFFSPLQFLYFYNTVQQLNANPVIDIWRDLPATWQETRVLEARIGEYVVMARRQGDGWYLGVITNPTPRTLSVPLNFLGAGGYQATLYSDGATGVVISQRLLHATDALDVTLAANGGLAALLRPVKTTPP